MRRRRAPSPTGPLSVLFVVPDLGMGGAERHVTSLLPAMDPERFTPSVLCLGVEGALFGSLARAGVPARALHRSKRAAALTLLELLGHLRTTRPDVVVVRGYSAEVLGRVAAILTRVPVVLAWVHQGADIHPRGRVRRALDGALNPRTTAVLGVARAQVPYLTGRLGFAPAQVRIVPHGTDLDPVRGPRVRREIAAELGLSPTDLVIGVVAVLRPEKDHATLLQAFAAVRDELPAARLLVVGDGPARAALQARAGDLCPTGSVVFAGNRDDVPDVLRVIDVLTLPSLTESFPLALLEAMAAGVPVVATAVGGVPEIVDDGVTGHLVPPAAPRELAARLVDLLRDPARARAMGSAGRARAEELFGHQESVRRAERVIEAAAGRRNTDPTDLAAVDPVGLTVVLDQVDLGGAEVVLLELVRALDPARVRARLVCLRREGNIAEDFRRAGCPVETVARTGRYDLRTVPRLVALFRAHATGVVLVMHHQRAALTLGRLAARLARVPANVVAVHDMDLAQLGDRCLPRHVVQTLFASDALVLLSASQGAYLREHEGVGRAPWARAPMHVIPNGVPAPPRPDPADAADVRRELGLDPEAVVVGVVARLSLQKQHETLLAATRALAGSRPQLALVVVGGGPREGELRALAEQWGLADRVVFTGPRRDVHRLLAAFDLFCLSSRHEGAPIAVLEAMTAGLPIVSTDCGALGDMVDDGAEGFLVPVGDVDALAARIALLVDDPELRSRLGKGARERAEREFRIERTARAYEDLLASLGSP